MIMQAMQRAEAAQQQLMSEGKLAEAARQGNRAISSILETHSKLQQLYHKAWRALMEQYGQLAVTPGGLAYAICCDLLGNSAVATLMQEPEEVSKQPGDSISSESLKKAVAAAVASRKQQPLAQLASSLLNAPQECIFVMPSLPGMMLTGPIGPAGAKVQPLLVLFTRTAMLDLDEDRRKDLHDVLQGGGEVDGSNLLLQAVEELLLAAFSKQPVLELQQSATQVAFMALANTGKSSDKAMLCVSDVISTLPDLDASFIVQAELEGHRWAYQGHAHPFSDPYAIPVLNGLLLQLRIICLTTAVSHITCNAMLEQLEGSRPLGDWGDVVQAYEGFTQNPDLKFLHGWAVSQAVLLKLLPQQQSVKAYPNTADEVMDIRQQMTDLGQMSLTGFVETYTDLLLLGHAQTTLGVKARVVQPVLADHVVLALRQYKAMLTVGKLEAVDAGNGCFPFMIYWLEIQQMALQLAGGKPGPAAKAAALQLLRQVPHSAVIARSALRVCNRTVAEQSASAADHLPTATFRVQPMLQARALARGDWPLAAQIVATGRVPDNVRQRAETPYYVGGSSSGAQAPAAAAEELLRRLTAQSGSVRFDEIVKLYSSAGSSGSVRKAYDPALCAAFEPMLQEQSQKRKHTLDDLWFVVGLMQQRLLQAAGGDPGMTQLLLGPGTLTTDFLKPVGDFFADKQRTAGLFAQAVCDAGWRLSSKTVCEVASGFVFEFVPPSGHGFRSSLWAVAALLSDPREWLANKRPEDGHNAYTLTSRALSRHSWSAPSDDALAAQLPVQFDVLSWLAQCSYPESIVQVRTCCWIVQLVLSASGSLSALEPAVQAIVQATAKSVVRFPGTSLDMPAVLGLVESVPLLHAADYELALKLPGADVEWDKVWAAAVAASTDLQLAATPAFGGKRPSLPWLLQLLQDSWQAVEKTAAAPNHLAADAASIDACSSSALLLLQPVVAAAKRLLQQQSSGESPTAAQQLLSTVLTCLSTARGLSYSGVVQPVMQEVLTILQDAATAGVQLQLPQLPSALSAAVSAGAAAGDLGFLHAATEEGVASVLQLSEQDQSLLYWAGIAGSAQGMQDASCAEVCKQQLLQLWGVSVSTADPQQVLKAAAAGVAAALMHNAAAGGTLCEQLLDTAALPAAVAAALLQAFCQGQSAHDGLLLAKLAVVQQLLAHVQQYGVLQQLQPTVLEAALQVLLGAAMSSAGSVGVPLEALPLLEALLQSGAVVSTPTAQQVLVCMRTHPDFGQQLQELLQQQQDTAHVASAQVLLCTLLQQLEAQAVPAQQSWELYQLLQQLGGAQQLPPQGVLAVCSVLILQQSTSTGADATPRLLQLWQQAVTCAGSAAAAVEQLGREVIQRALPALVAAGEQQEALEAVELMPALLPTLAQLWQEQQQPVAADLVVRACRLSIATGTAGAADAAEVLLPLLLQITPEEVTSSASAPASPRDPAGELYTELLQLVCKHSRPAAVLELFKSAAPHMVSQLQAASGAEPAAGEAGSATAAAAAAVVVMVNAGSSQQQQQLVQLLSSSEGDTVLLAQAALAAVLTAPTPSAAAVALLLHALQQGRKEQLATLLQPAELNRLCTLVCSSSSSGSSAQEQTSFKLPTAAALAAQCCADRSHVSAATGAMLANTLAANHPHLQPTCAAAALGTVLPPAAVSSTHSTAATAAAPPPADSWQVSKVLAQLCFQQLLAGLSPAISSMDEDAGAICADLEGCLAGWVPALSPAAAAAAMFAVGLHWEQLVTATAPAGVGTALPEAQMQLAEPVLVLELYQRAKSSGDSLVFDMGLVAAAEAAELTGDWHRGESIIAAAQKAFQQAAAEGSKGSSSSNSRWTPVLPAARCALLSTLVHTQGVTAAGKLLLTELEQQPGVQQGQGRATAPVGRKGKAASGVARPPAAAAVAVTAPAARLLSLPVVNSFLATAVKVAVGYQQEATDEEAEAAARAAVEVFTEIFKLQVAAVSLAATGAAGAVPAGGANSLRPNADSWLSVLQLHGCLGSLPQVSSIVLAACRQQLPGVSSESGLQAVLAAAAGAFNAASKHTAAVQLLDGLVAAGVTAVSHPMLAQQLLDATENSSEAEQELVQRLLEGDSGIYELLDVEEAQSGSISSSQGSGAAVGAVQLVQLDAVEAMQKLIRNIRSV